MVQEAIILAGGFGTRLAHLLVDIPKPMIEVRAFPFLHYQLQYLKNQGVKKVILSVGYRSNSIENYFKNEYLGISIIYCKEDEPLGTGGAIKKALSYTQSNHVLVLNGDSFFPINLSKFFQFHVSKKSTCTLALKMLTHFDRYGTVEIKNDAITQFYEKKKNDEGLINGGIYLINKDSFLQYSLPIKFSMENDFFEKYCAQSIFFGYISDAYFIDIGIPEDYYKFCEDIKQMEP